MTTKAKAAKANPPDVKTKLAARGGKATAIHLANGKHEAIGLWNLRVLIVPDEQFWFAQGLEINYGAQGDSPQDAQTNFQEGLIATIQAHLETYGDITRILKFAPSHVLQEAAEKKKHIKTFKSVRVYEVLKEADVARFPFENIDYAVMEAVA